MIPDPHQGPPPWAHGPEPPRREPIFNIPRVVLAVIGALVAIHLMRQGLDLERDLQLISELAVVPARFALELGWLDQQRLVDALGVVPGDAALRLAVAQYFVDGAGPRWWSLMSYGLLHANGAHVGMNMVWLAVFGTPVARRFGPAGFLALLAVGTVAGAALHIAADPADVAPMIGASAAVSAATGAAARFVFSLGLRIDTMADDRAVRALPALSLAGMVRNRQALLFVALWFGTNWLFGAGVVGFAGSEQGVAWLAHVGGFMAGLLLFPLFDRHAMSGPV